MGGECQIRSTSGMGENLDALVRRIDEDRWLASRFAPKRVRVTLLAIYALNYEIARTAEIVTDAAIGAIRLAWWREAVGELHDGLAPRAHPALLAYAQAWREAALPRAALERMIDARGKDFDAAAFEDWTALDDYLDATAGAVFQLAIAVCAEAPVQTFDAFVSHAGRAWGYAGLARAAPFWAARGRSLFPRGDNCEALERGRAAYAQARVQAKQLPSALFPAIGYLAFLPGYYRVLGDAPNARSGDSTLTPLLTRQLLLLRAAATGSI